MSSCALLVVTFVFITAVGLPCITCLQEDCGKLSPPYRAQLKSWIRQDVDTFKLLYSARRDGCNANAFHKLADKKGRTVTVLYQGNKTVFGGYASVEWTKAGYQNDSSAFLYVLQLDGQNINTLMPTTGQFDRYAVFSDENSGPTFGGHHDLQTFHGRNCVNVSDGFESNGYVYPGFTFESQGLNRSQFEKNHTFWFTDLEVYQVSKRHVEEGRLTEPYISQLQKWIGGGLNNFKLLYRASRDGCSASSFHSRADNQGPTITVLYQQNRTVFGGFASVNWTKAGYQNDSNAFLYVLKLNGTDTHILMPTTGTWDKYAIYSDENSGPIFGGHHDLQTFHSRSCVNVSGGFQSDGYVYPGFTFDSKGLNRSQFENNHTFWFTDLEVYKVYTDPCNPATSPLTSTTVQTTVTSTTAAPAVATTTNGINMSQSFDGMRCLSCWDAEHLRYCDTAERCQKDQVCYIERHQKRTKFHYSAGCILKQACPSQTQTPTSGRCFQCCTTDFCNVKGCGDTGLAPIATRGPMCLDCRHFSNPGTCDKLTFCAPSESCIIEGFRWGGTEMFYNLGCSGQQNCLGHTGKRSRPVCRHCCGSDFCNTNCTTTGTLDGQPVPANLIG